MYAAPESPTIAPGTDAAFERHTLVWLDDRGWRAAQDAVLPLHQSALKLWQRQNWPMVVRRADVGTPADEICLGLPLPPDEETGNKIRISVRAKTAHVARSSAAIPLAETAKASGKWRDAIADLLAAAGELDLRVYGSLAMQTLTGLPYVTASSDIDILFRPTNRSQLNEGVTLLAQRAGRLPLDGEVVFPDGQAVAWREWRMALENSSRVIVKELHQVRLADTRSLMKRLDP